MVPQRHYHNELPKFKEETSLTLQYISKSHEEEEESRAEISVSENVIFAKSFIGVIEEKEKEIQQNMQMLQNSPNKLSIIERLKRNRKLQLDLL
jgi:hypothetical protein